MNPTDTIIMDRILGKDGVFAVVVVAGGPAEAVGLGDYGTLAIHCLRSFDCSVTSRSIRLTTGDIAVHCLDDNGCHAAVVTVKGHPVVKSTQRMLRQICKKCGTGGG